MSLTCHRIVALYAYGGVRFEWIINSRESVLLVLRYTVHFQDFRSFSMLLHMISFYNRRQFSAVYHYVTAASMLYRSYVTRWICIYKHKNIHMIKNQTRIKSLRTVYCDPHKDRDVGCAVQFQLLNPSFHSFQFVSKLH